MKLALEIIIIILCAMAARRAAGKLHIPAVAALIILGLVIGIPPIKKLLIAPYGTVISHIGDAGLLCLMFLAGLESSWKMLYKEKKDASLIAVLSALVPLALGLVAFTLLGLSLQVSLILGVCMSISAEATRAKVLMEMHKMESRVGSALIGAGIVDDLLGLSLFVVITYFVQQTGTKEELLVVMSLIVFFIGLAVRRIAGMEGAIMKCIRGGFDFLVIPFFFVSIGVHFDFGSLVLNPFILLSILIIAVTGKLAGAFLTRPFLDFNWKQLHLVGWSMNSRGALELALALVAFRSGLIARELYSSLIVMAIVTTVSFPFIMTYMASRNPDIFD